MNTAFAELERLQVLVAGIITFRWHLRASFERSSESRVSQDLEI
jgi:hypothetical protein